MPVEAIYARQSVDKKDSLSVEGQIDLCRKFVGEEAVVYEDRGFSGKNIKRPAFLELMQAVESGQIQKICVYRLDRFSRSIADFSRIWETLEQNGVEFVSVTENFDTSSPMGRAMLNIVLVFAQLERETIAERVRDNYRHRFVLGAWPGGPAPYGFDLTKIDENGRRVSALIPNEKADVVVRIFEEYARSDISLRALARSLTQQGIHGPKREAWDNVTLSRILHSPLYVQADESVYWYYLTQGFQIESPPEAFDGVHACNMIGRRERNNHKSGASCSRMLTVANHAGLIDARLWLRVQEKLEGNLQLSRVNAGKYTWLTGLLKCGKCGYAVKVGGAGKNGKHPLLCSGRSNFSNCDGEIYVDLSELEAEVSRKIKELLSLCPGETLRPVVREKNAEELLSIDRRIQRLLDALSESTEVSAGYISRRIEQLHTERETLLSKEVPDCRETPKIDFDHADFAEKKLIAAEFIDRILLNGAEAEVIWNI